LATTTRTEAAGVSVVVVRGVAVVDGAVVVAVVVRGGEVEGANVVAIVVGVDVDVEVVVVLRAVVGGKVVVVLGGEISDRSTSLGTESGRPVTTMPVISATAATAPRSTHLPTVRGYDARCRRGWLSFAATSYSGALVGSPRTAGP
jgi:hypothetical protein